MEVTEGEFEQAEERMQALRRAGHVVAAHYDRSSALVVATLDTGVAVSFPPAMVEGLAGMASDDLAEIEISPAGLGLHWPKLDADVYMPALLLGVFGSKSWMARQLGTAGGHARSAAKAAASRENGRKGGRPRKTANG